LGAILGPGFEVSLVRAANRQTVELVLDGAMQFRIVHTWPRLRLQRRCWILAPNGWASPSL
jgi:hypothetical protein